MIVVLAAVAATLLTQVVVLAPRRPPRPHGRSADRSATRRLARRLDDETAVRRGLLAALVVGLVLRVAWAILATETPTAFEDGAEYLRTAQGFLDGDLPTFRSGASSAFWSPGYPLLLVAFLGVADLTGWASPPFTASLVNAVGGTVTIGLTAFLAGRWISPRARLPAAWLVALTPALVFWTSTAHTESTFTAVFLGGFALATVAVDQPDGGSARRWLAIGVLTGAAFLIRSPAVVLFLVPLLAGRARRGRWAGAWRPTGLLLVGAALVLVPWTVRNGVQVGVWTPNSTSNATGPCFGHHDDAEAQFEHPTDDLLRDCFRGSPFDDERLRAVLASTGGLPPGWEFGRPDEAQWYQERLTEAARWAVTHPAEEARLSALKVWQAWEDEDHVVEVSRSFAPEEDGWRRWSGPLQAWATTWLWLLEALAVAALVTVPSARRALPVWGLIVTSTILIVGGVAYPNYRYPVVPLVAVLAAAFLAGPRAPAPRSP